MQNIPLFFLFLLLFFLPAKIYGYDYQGDIKNADRLFGEKKYIESLEVYEKIYKKSKKASPRMLLKMAFIYEGLDDYTHTLYYLNLYYMYTSKPETLAYIEKTANEYRLKGYEYSDMAFIKAFYTRYFVYLTGSSLLVIILVLGFISWKSLRGQPVHRRYQILLMLILAGLFLLINYTGEKSQAIVQQDYTYLMSAPSAGSSLVKIIPKGHKVQVLEKKDIWYKILWNKKHVYVRKSNLLILKPL